MHCPVERLAPWLVGTLGLVYLFVTPPFQVPDEPAHLYRAYQVATGGLLATGQDGRLGGEVPVSLWRTIEHVDHGVSQQPDVRQDATRIMSALDIPLLPDDRAFFDFANTGLFGPVPYMPQAVGIGIGRLFGAPPIVLVYLGRLASLALTAWLVTLAVRRAPVFKHVILLVACMPMAATLTASLSADGPTLALSLLLVASWLAAVHPDSPEPSRRQLFDLALLGMLVASCKSVYFPLALLVLSIPGERLAALSSPRAYRWVVASLGLLTALGWSLLAESRFVPFHPGDYASFADARAFITDNPLRYASMLGDALAAHSAFHLRSLVANLGWLDTVPHPVFYKLYLGVLVGVALVDGRHPAADTSLASTLVPRRGTRLLLIGIVGAIVALVLTSQLLLWTTVGAEHIGPTQGRYFLPAVLPVLLLVANPWLGSRVSARTLTAATLMFTLAMLAWIVVVLAQRFWVA